MSGTVWVEVPAEWVVASGMYTFLQDRGPCFGPVLAIEPDAPSAPPSTRCGCDQDPIECNHQAARGQAEAAVARVRTLATTWAALAPGDDWADNVADTLTADCGRAMLSALDQPKEPT